MLSESLSSTFNMNFFSHPVSIWKRLTLVIPFVSFLVTKEKKNHKVVS